MRRLLGLLFALSCALATPAKGKEPDYSVSRRSCGKTRLDPDSLARELLRRRNVTRVQRVTCVTPGDSLELIKGSTYLGQAWTVWVVEAEGHFCSPRAARFSPRADGTLAVPPTPCGPCGAYFYRDDTGDTAGFGIGPCPVAQ
jgi:hypothetical protein